MAEFGRDAGGRFNSNFSLGRLGFGVGNPDFLNSEASKVALYYRGLEYGSTKFLGREIFGLFGSGSRMDFKGGELSAPGRGSGQQFFPLRYIAEFLPGGGTATAKALRYLRRNGGSKTHGSNVVATIKNPIVAQNAYKDAYASFGPGAREEEAVRQVLGGLIGVVDASKARPGAVVDKTTPLIDQRFRRASPVTSAQIRQRSGFLSGGALSGYTGSLARIDQTLIRELIQINKKLAEGLASEVARLQQEAIKRPGTESGRLIEATTDARNRFPS